MKLLLHIGCGNNRFPNLVNTDKDEMDISKPWPYANDSVDGIVSMQVLQCLNWLELLASFLEAYRVLRKGGIMRMGINLVEENYPLERILYGANINLFSYDLLKNVLINRVGFSEIKRCKWRESKVPEFVQVDNRHHRGSSYIEVVK